MSSHTTDHKTILIIGGTRFIGPAVVQQLQARNCEVTLFHRGQTGTDLCVGVQRILGDRERLADFRSKFESVQPDIVIDMAPLSEAHAQSVVETFRDIVSRIVTISSCDVYRSYGKLIGLESGDSEALPLDEASPLRETRFPYRGKAERYHDYEKILVEEVTIGSGNPKGTVLRLPIVYGPRDYQHRLWPYLKRMRDGRPILLENAHAEWRVSRAYVGDVAEAIVSATLDDRAAGQTYNVAEVQCYTEREWAERVGRAIGWEGNVITVDGKAFPDMVDSDFHPQHHLVVDSRKLRSELPFRETVDSDAALRSTIDWELSHPPEPDPVTEADYKLEDAVIAKWKRATP